MLPPLIRLTDYAAQRAVTLGSLYRNTRSDGRCLYQHMELNNWYGFVHEGSGLNVTVRIPECFPQLDLWLTAYGRSDDEKYDLLRASLPHDNVLAAGWTMYAQRHPEMSLRSKLDCLDYLASQPDTDPSAWDREDVEAFILQAVTELTHTGACLVLDYVLEQTAGNSALQQASYEYRICPKGGARPTHALALNDYASLAWLVFSEEAAEEGHYIEKAAQSRLSAEMWLFVGLHFVCALRISDLCRLPVPDISAYCTTVRDRILNGNFSIGECTELVNSWLTRITLEGNAPNKTSRFQGITPISISIPSSLYPMFGKMLALAASYVSSGEALLSRRYATVQGAVDFFGENFRKHCGSGFFLSTRRLNKSYLQGAENYANNQGHVRIQGYMLASILRSHKVRYGDLSDITDVYLRDGDFSGMTPETVAAEMFERGIFGFIPCLLLSRYDSTWHMFSLHDQTAMIHSLGLAPTAIEQLSAQLSQAHTAVRKVLSDGFRESNGDNMAATKILTRIIQEQAPGKTSWSMCLRSAVGLPCIAPEASTCLTCPYAIWTRVSIHVLLEEYERNIRLLKSAVFVEQIRLKKINDDFLLPALREILVSITGLAPNSDAVKGFTEMMQWRLAHAKNS